MDRWIWVPSRQVNILIDETGGQVSCGVLWCVLVCHGVL